MTLDEAGIEYEVRGAVGDPADRVTAMAEDHDADFVVVGGRNQSSARRTLFGSVSQEILESVRCPVISVREGVYE
ncbi:universal stress protein [Halalkalicoccus sp. NIPERK01]|uniref:universal stress protein n=1 Tax=Halalkalicoccus sp. NIPERK01 TaxID=3053469 RepID=UPI00256F503A|nr:universal stress protein [Halalkalicoccus sp. NIPERK01]MDL5363151.1 universal stress protein [Halalkalicoccus sp. NIPERK01]